MTIQEISTPSLRLLIHSADADLRLHHITALPRQSQEGEAATRALPC